jgi:hypothetical protein
MAVLEVLEVLETEHAALPEFRRQPVQRRGSETAAATAIARHVLMRLR